MHNDPIDNDPTTQREPQDVDAHGRVHGDPAETAQPTDDVDAHSARFFGKPDEKDADG